MKFIDRENQSIKRLVQISWEALEDHHNEVLLLPERDFEITRLINESDKLAEESSPDREKQNILNISHLDTAKPMRRRKRLHPPPIIAVDAGVVNLGSLAKGGTVFAIRGAACYYKSSGELLVLRYNTGAIAIDNTNKLKVLHHIGKRLGDSQFFVKEIEEEPYLLEKGGTSTTNQIQDRCRNFVERIIQAEAVGILKECGGGILLIDGALPATTFDTPKNYILNESKSQGMLFEASRNLIDVVAISKKTTITVDGIPIQNLLNEKYGADFIGYVPIKKIVIKQRREEKKLGNSVRIRITMAKQMYAAKFGFSPSSITFRVDLHNCLGKTSDEVINDVYNYCRIYGGYPKPLIEAHQYSCFMFQDCQNLVAQATVRLGVRPQEQPTMEILFQPFGSFGK